MGTRRRLPPPPRKPRLKIEDHSKKHSVDLCGLRCAPFRMPSLLLKADISGYIPRCRCGVRFTPKADICSATRDVCFGPKADIGSAQAHVCFGPKADSCTAANSIAIRSPRRREQGPPAELQGLLPWLS